MITTAEHAAFVLLPVSLVAACLLLCAGEFPITRLLTGAAELQPEEDEFDAAQAFVLAAGDGQADTVAQAAASIESALTASEAGDR